jgi:hypothetical protein
MRAALSLVAVALATVGVLAVAPSAFAPPATGVPNVGVAGTCFAYNQRIPVAGSGFAPGTRVVVSAPFGHYTGPLPYSEIKSTTVTAGPSGRVRANLRAPKVPKSAPPYRWSYQPRVVFAEGTGQTSGSPGQSFAEFVVASRAVCRALDHPRRGN